MKDKSKYILPIVLVLLIGLGIFAWLKTESLSDFGLNFTTEIIGVLITIYIADYLLQSRENSRLAPMKIIVYQDISVLYNRYMGLFFELYSLSVNETPPITTKDFVENDCIYKALLYSSVEGKPRIDPPQSMAQYLESKAKDFETRAEKILDKYSNFLTPEIAKLLHEMFSESVMISTMKMMPKIMQIRANLPYPKSLAYYLYNFEEKDKKNIIKLNDWLVNERKKLLKLDNDIRTVKNPEYLSKRNDSHQYIYRIEENTLLNQIKEFEKWKTTSANTRS